MTDFFVACAACARHVREGEAACPFCGEAIPEGTAAPRPPARSGPITRAAILFVGATAAAGCGGSTEGGNVPLYGPAPVDGSFEASNGDGGGEDGGGIDGGVVLYGPAMVDSSVDADSGPVAAYGPAPTDSGGG
jgi:hypothetical protein